jgi:hypothetical protein
VSLYCVRRLTGVPPLLERGVETLKVRLEIGQA